MLKKRVQEVNKQVEILECLERSTTSTVLEARTEIPSLRCAKLKGKHLNYLIHLQNKSETFLVDYVIHLTKVRLNFKKKSNVNLTK